jgi:hypothetical protein
MKSVANLDDESHLSCNLQYLVKGKFDGHFSRHIRVMIQQRACVRRKQRK